MLPGGGAALPNWLNLLGVHGGFKPWIVEVAPDSSTLLLLVGAGLARHRPDPVQHPRQGPGVGGGLQACAPDEGPIEVRLMWRHGDANPALRTVKQVAIETFGGSAA